MALARRKGRQKNCARAGEPMPGRRPAGRCLTRCRLAPPRYIRTLRQICTGARQTGWAAESRASCEQPTRRGRAGISAGISRGGGDAGGPHAGDRAGSTGWGVLVGMLADMTFVNAGTLGTIGGHCDEFVALRTRRNDLLRDLGCHLYEVGVTDDVPDTVFVVEIYGGVRSRNDSR